MNPSDRSKDKRSRIARACDLCRRKKVKCHFRPGEPCFNCITYGEKCIFQSETKKRGPPKGYVEELEHKIQQTERLIQQKTGRDNIDELLEEIDVAKANKRKMKEEQRIMRRADSPSYRTFTDLDALHSREWPPGISYDSVFYLGDLEGWQFFSHKLPLDEQRDVKWKGHYIRKFGDRVVLVADDGKKNPSGTKVPGLQWMQPAARPKGIHQYIYWVAGIDQHTSSRLLKIYFANIHPILPVINKREFLRQYRDISDAYPTGELLNAMFGAAARFAECEQLDPERVKMIPPDARWDVPVGWSDHFFDQAQNIITRSANHPTISKIQAIVLTHNQRGDIDSKSSACWLMGGLAIRLAQGLGLNRNCDDWDIPDREKQVRKRVWWALYACDRFQSALHGRPLGIRDEDNDVGYPDIHANYNEVMDIPVEDDED